MLIDFRNCMSISSNFTSQTIRNWILPDLRVDMHLGSVICVKMYFGIGGLNTNNFIRLVLVCSVKRDYTYT